MLCVGAFVVMPTIRAAGVPGQAGDFSRVAQLRRGALRHGGAGESAPQPPSRIATIVDSATAVAREIAHTTRGTAVASTRRMVRALAIAVVMALAAPASAGDW